MILVIAEKPSVGRDIARVLHCTQRGDGCLRGDKYIVSWAVGHLVTLCEPDELDEKYKKWRMDTLPILPDVIPTKVIPQTRAQYKVLKTLMLSDEVDSLICATDAGREGELIFRLIYHQVKCKKPVMRLWISSMTDEAIKDGFAQLKPGSEYDGLYKSAECRSKADWLVGMNASRAFTLRYDALLSIGRVQTPTLAILVKRKQEIEQFKPTEFYTVTALFQDYTGIWFDEKAEDEKTASRIDKKETADEIAALVKGKNAAVRSCEAEDKREMPPLLYDLTALQRDANRMLGFTASKTLKVAQALYEEKKCLTYPRTDSRYLPLDMQEKAKQTLQALPQEYAGLVSGVQYQADGRLPVFKRVFDNAKISDHHALIPTPKRPDLSKMTADERNLYDMVARRLIAVFYPPYEYTSLKVITDCEKNAFKSTGTIVKNAGWKAVYAGEDKKDKDKDPTLPALQKGDTRTVKNAAVKQDATKPPAQHTDSSLLYAMENAGRELEDEALRDTMKGSGLGTPATRAAIIERLISVGYAVRKGKIICATDKGTALISVVPNEIASPEMTGKWELALDEIAENKRDTERFMQGITRFSAFLVEYARDKAENKEFPADMKRKSAGRSSKNYKEVKGIVCPLCGKKVMETVKAFGCSAWKEGCHFTVWKDCLSRTKGPEITEKLLLLLLQKKELKGSTGVLKLDGKTIRFSPSDNSIPPAEINIEYIKHT